MRRQSIKMAVVGGLVALIVLFGIEIATSGVERIYGPLDQGTALPVGRFDGSPVGSAYPQSAGQEGLGGGVQDDRQNGQDGAYDRQSASDQQELTAVSRRTVAEAEKGLPPKRRDEIANSQAPQNERLPGIPSTQSDSSVNKLADGTAGVLQSVTSQGIRFIVSFFDSITD